MSGSSGAHLVGRGRSMLEQLLRMAQTRLELLSVEVQQEKLALVRQIKLAALLGGCALLSGITLILWIALAFPPDMRFVLLGVLFAVLAGGAVASWVLLRRASAGRAPLFGRVIEQLRLDRASLNQHP